MGEHSKIEWTHHTFNPWVGCTKVSAACDLCYAEAWAKRSGHPELWTGGRRRTTADNWKQPIKWNEAARASGERHRVFCASLADVFDNQVPGPWRRDLAALIDSTPDLDWLLLTKRPQNATRMLMVMFARALGEKKIPRDNVWIGTTVENQTEAERRIPQLINTPAVIRFLSCEPLLGPINFTIPQQEGFWLNYLRGLPGGPGDHSIPRVDWVIAGGESGGEKARPMRPEWVRAIRDQCAAAGVPFFMKQWGEHAPSVIDGAEWIFRVGKKKAGRHLDGVLHSAFPP